MKELCGKQAPADGLVFIAPSDLIGRLGAVNYQTLIWQLGRLSRGGRLDILPNMEWFSPTTFHEKLSRTGHDDFGMVV